MKFDDTPGDGCALETESIVAWKIGFFDFKNTFKHKEGKKIMDMMTANPVRDSLMKQNQTFRDLVRQHENYEKRLTELAGLTYPSDAELLEESTLKKKKLAIKDEIYTMMQNYSGEVSH